MERPDHIHCIDLFESTDIIISKDGEFLHHCQECNICGLWRIYTEKWSYPDGKYSYQLDEPFTVDLLFKKPLNNWK